MRSLLAHLRVDNPALAWWDETEGWLSYGELCRRVEQLSHRYPAGRQLVYLPFANTTTHLIHYLLGLRDGHVMMLADPAQPDEVSEQLCQHFAVSVQISPEGALQQRSAPAPLHADLSVLLPTSGSTGSCKWVRLSSDNLATNAASIVQYLKLDAHERAITSLPLFYSFGMSVLNSHLQVGGSLVQTSASPLERSFWHRVDELGVTSVAGVPFTYQMLKKLRFDWGRHPTLTTLTQAGGRLEPELTRHFAEQASLLGRRFFVMYGQTEAAPRMAWLAHDEVLIAPDAIGRAVPGGEFSLRHEPGLPAGQGELVYRGPNVMLGYATSASDLALGRTIDELHTGDIGWCDDAGRYHLCGRLSRFLKLFGKRVSLAEVESWLSQQGVSAAATGRDDRLKVAIEGESVPSDLQVALANWLRVAPSAVSLHQVASLPRRSNLKIDYVALLQQLEALA